MEQEYKLIETEKVTEYFDREGIEYAVFDLDDTLVDTHTYFKNSIEGAGYLFLRMSNFQGDMYLDANSIFNHAVNIHKESDTPIEVTEITLRAIERYKKGNPKLKLPSENNFSIEELITKYQEDFYNESPEIFPDIPDFLYQIYKTGRPILIHTNAQEGWTGIKRNAILSEIERNYNEIIPIQYHCTPINRRKNLLAWLEAEESLQFNFRNSIIFGDNLCTDIYPAIEAGCKNVVHIDRNQKIKEIEREGYRTVNRIGNTFLNI